MGYVEIMIFNRQASKSLETFPCEIAQQAQQQCIKKSMANLPSIPKNC